MRARIARMVHKVLVSWLVLALLAPRLSADDSSRELKAAQAQATRAGHPYKWPGLIMIGIGGLVSVAAVLGAAGVEGASFRQCRATRLSAAPTTIAGAHSGPTPRWPPSAWD